jgi:hypothetical protein
MRRPVLVAVCVLAACGAPPAHAAPHPPRGVAYAGPALAGDTMVWGEMYPDRSGAVLSRSPGGRVRVLTRLPRMRGKGDLRSFGGIPGALSASPGRIAFALEESHSEPVGGDVVGTAVRVRPRVAVPGGRFADALPRCEAGYVSTAADGDSVAVAMVGGGCEGVWVDGRRLATTGFLRQVRLAGRYVGWLEWPHGDPRLARVVVAEKATGAVAGTFTAVDLGVPHEIDRFALDAAGDVVALVTHRVVVTALTDRTPRTIATGAAEVATAGGRVLYIAHRRLVLAGLDGHIERTLERYGPRRQPVGELALTAGRAAWSVMLARGERVGGNVIRDVRGRVRTAKL